MPAGAAHRMNRQDQPAIVAAQRPFWTGGGQPHMRTHGPAVTFFILKKELKTDFLVLTGN
jgi:hypothetical protein